MLSCFVVAGVYLYTKYLDKATVAAVSQDYYFLVADTTHVEASAYQIVLDGGAGYFLEVDEGEFVTVAVYSSQAEAESVQVSLLQDTRVISLNAGNLYFKSKTDKKNAKQIVNAFQLLGDYVQVLSGEIVRMEKGGTQESCKRMLETLKRQFIYLAKEYKSVFQSYAKLCDRTANSLSKMLNETIFVSNLRNLQCDLCYSYVSLAKEFAL